MRLVLAISVMFASFTLNAQVIKENVNKGLNTAAPNTFAIDNPVDNENFDSTAGTRFQNAASTDGFSSSFQKAADDYRRQDDLRKRIDKEMKQIQPTEVVTCNADGRAIEINFKEPVFSADILKSEKKCESAGQAVGVSCNIAQYAPMATQAIQGITSSSMGGDPKKACEDAEKLADVSGALNGLFGGACMRTSNVCIDNCGTMRTTYENAASKVREETGRVNAEIQKLKVKAREYNNNAETANRSKTQADPEGSFGGHTTTDWLIKKSKLEQEIEVCETQLRDKQGDANEKLNLKKGELAEKTSKCEQMGQYAGGALAQSFASVATKMQAQNCQKFYAASDCKSLEDLRTKPMCKPVLCDCMSGAYRTFAECGDYKCDVDCTKTENMQLQVCFCKANPGDPACPGGGGPNGNGTGGPVITGGTNPNGDTFTNGLNGGFSDDQIKSLLADENAPEQNPFGDKKDGSSSGSGQQMQPGAPFAAGGGSNYQGNPAAGGKGGAGKGSYNTDILGGAPGASGGAFGSGGAYPIGGNGDANNRNGLNLKDFLPGGKGAQRALAGKLELEKNGISEANGLSNWQKVNRQMKNFQQGRQILVTP